MSFRNWLLTGTSLTILAFAPVSVAYAQDSTDPALVAAYEAFRADQNDSTQQALMEACIAAGFPSLDACIAALSGVAPVEQAPAEPAPPAEEPAPPPAEQPAPPPEPAPAPVKEPAPTPVQEPAPAPVEEPAADPVEEPAPAPAPEPAPAPVAEEPAPAPEQPAPVEEPAAPSAEEAAPVAEPSVEAPVTSEQPAVDVLGQLTAAVDLYNQGAAELDAGNAEGQAKVDAARDQIQAICATAGFTDVDACLAQFGLALNPLPPTASEQPAISEEPLVTEPSGEQVTESPLEQPISELPNADEPVTDTAIEVLPESVPPEEAAPILDSSKDLVNEGEAPPAPSQEPAAPVEALPPPPDDAAAQAEIAPPTEEVQAALTEEGTENASFDFGFVTPDTPEATTDEQAQVQIIERPTADKPQFIFQVGINIYITNIQQERDRYYDRNRDRVYYEDLSRGRVRETIERPDGTRIVTIYNRYGDVLQRTKIYPDDREFYLATYDPRDRDEDSFFLDPGNDLPPLRLNIPARDYILDASFADEEEVEFFLEQPPVEQVRRIYSIDEVKRSARLRDSVRRLEIGGLTFDTGKATIARDQVSSLSGVAAGMLKLLDRNPAEVFLIEGHTDAVGSDVSNLVLSDQRAATVARILSDFYDIPPENLVTQGYGERFLKVKTERAEPLNRRVVVKRITPLVSYQASR